MPVLPISTDQIVVTASRVPQPAAESPASVTVIDGQSMDRLDQPLAAAYLRFAPSVAVATSGPAGSFTEVRIRGAENNHTLLFIDGIRANDPASGDFSRFELLNADLVSRIEIVRGPQSALWGSDAIGGVIAVNGTDDVQGYGARLEGGSYGFARASASASSVSANASLGGAVGFQRSGGIDSFGAPGGDRDGFRNLSGRLRAMVHVARNMKLTATGFALNEHVEFDGYDPLTFEHTDTLDNTRSRLSGGRIAGEFGSDDSAWSGHVAASLLGSVNRNFLGRDAINRTSGRRRTVDAQVEHNFETGRVQHQLIAAAEIEQEAFHARGLSSGLSTDQDRTRKHQAITAEWRVRAGALSVDLAIRRDMFNRFADATTLRGSVLAQLGDGFSAEGSYGEGMAQPTFFDQYGTFPNNFIGNPSLNPETSRGFEGSLRYRRAAFSASLTAYRQRLHHEIVDQFDLSTFLASAVNSKRTSHRAGLEAQAEWRVTPSLRMRASYAFLHATQPEAATGFQVRERRRPKHSGSVEADGVSGRWSYGASITYAGSHLDTLEVAPYGVTRVKPYWLADARVGYAVRGSLELFVRGSNLLNSDYQEVAGYRTEGIGGFVGIKLADRRSSP